MEEWNMKKTAVALVLALLMTVLAPCALADGGEFSGVTLTDSADLTAVFGVLSLNGWTIKTGICYILFSLFHFPCSTTLMTIKKETGSVKYTVLSAVIPTAIGFVLCFAVNLIYNLFI